MGRIKSFKELNLWKEGMILVNNVYDKTKALPASECYGLTAQMRRAAVSVPTNIAEGFRRQYPKEFRQFLNIVLGSLAELETEILIAGKLKYVEQKDVDIVCEHIDYICRMTVCLLKKL
jgi:four helix bundle protein